MITPAVTEIPLATAARDSSPRLRALILVRMNRWWSIESPNRIVKMNSGTQLSITPLGVIPRGSASQPSWKTATRNP